MTPSQETNVPHSFMQQIHGSAFTWVSSSVPVCQRQVDSQATAQPGLVLWVKTADCLPILWYHPAGAVGAIHAGRRGTRRQILQHTLQSVLENLGQPEVMTFWFGPAICAECYQIDRATNTHFDLRQENVAQLHQVLKPEQVKLTISPHCTLETPELSSYRRSGPGCPHHYWGIQLLKTTLGC